MADPKGLLVVPVGFRADGSLRALELDNSDRLKVLIDSITGSVTVRQDDPYEMSVGNYGWVSGGLQRQPITVGYSGVVNESKDNLNAAAGFNQLAGTVVPSGEIWEITNIHFIDYYNATVADTLFVSSAGVITILATAAALAANTPVIWNGRAILGPGDKLLVNFNGCALNDDLNFTYHGMRIDIDQ